MYPLSSRPAGRRLAVAPILPLALIALATAGGARAAEDADAPGEVLVIARAQDRGIENAPSTQVSLTGEKIAQTVNAVNIEDALKYLPSLILRKRHIGDNFAPIATRTSGLGASARSLIYADGALLSALIANNNGSGSPRWGLVTPEEVARIEVLYGPFSAAYSGSSIGTVVNITTRMPDRLEARAGLLTNIQSFRSYATDLTLPTRQVSASLGDRFGRLALLLGATRTISNGQPLAFVTAASAPTGTTGAFDDRNRTGGAIKVLGAGGIEHHVQDMVKLKAALDLTGAVQASYVVALWRDDSQGAVESYLRGATGIAYTSAFSSNMYSRDALHWSHSLSLRGGSRALDWELVGTLYDYGRDIQRSPAVAPPAAFTGGAGTVQRQDGTGWATLDAKAAWRIAGDDHVLSIGAHVDRYKVEADRYATGDWTSDAQGAVNQISRGKTRTVALWAQDALALTPRLTLTLGGRFEWWRAFDGLNYSAAPALSVSQPSRAAHGFSPKASVEWRPAEHWSARLSFGQAWRFPTVGELYQAIATGPTLTAPNPDLRPERARSEELAIQRTDARGSIRLSLFNESIADALIAQSGPLPGLTGAFTYVQNIERTRARGVELAVEQRDLLPRIDLSASLTYADAMTRADRLFPAAVGKLLPGVPRWKATTVLTWRPDPRLALTGAMRMSSRNYATLDNSDMVGNTYQGFDKYVVFDLRALAHVSPQFDLALGVDNVANDRYFLFHPFPQRSVTVQVNWKL